MLLSQPLIVKAPTEPYEDSLLIIQGNSLLAKNMPVFPLKLAVLGALMGRDDMEYLIRQKYPEMVNLLRDLTYCEARWQHDGLWGDNYQSYGLFQFQRKTFYSFCSQYWNWQNQEDQLDCAVILIKKGLGSTTQGWYNCWKIMNLFKYEIY